MTIGKEKRENEIKERAKRKREKRGREKRKNLNVNIESRPDGRKAMIVTPPLGQSIGSTS
jgi:hypothetical protein